MCAKPLRVTPAPPLSPPNPWYHSNTPETGQSPSQTLLSASPGARWPEGGRSCPFFLEGQRFLQLIPRLVPGIFSAPPRHMSPLERAARMAQHQEHGVNKVPAGPQL